MSTVDEENWFEAMTRRDQSEKTLVIEVRDGEGWKMIGNCGVFGIDPVNRLAELGIMLGEKDEWNKGYGTETMVLLLRHCFDTLNLNRAFLQVYAENKRAKRSYEKAGFVEEGCLRESVYKRGKYDDMIIMSVLRSEWIARMKEK
jgi:RimJ/RimL family protein N-acetyltransferase